MKLYEIFITVLFIAIAHDAFLCRSVAQEIVVEERPNLG